MHRQDLSRRHGCKTKHGRSKVTALIAMIAVLMIQSNAVAAFSTSLPQSTMMGRISQSGITAARRNRVKLIAHAAKKDSFQDSPPNPKSLSDALPSLFMVGLPVASLLFPWLVSLAKSLPPNSPDQLAVVTALFVSNRIYLYTTSATIVTLAAIRGATDTSGLGQRLQDLTEELLSRPALSDASVDNSAAGQDTAEQTAAETSSQSSKMVRSMFADTGLQESLDGVSSDSQALILPLLVTALLASSVSFLNIWNGGDLFNLNGADSTAFAEPNFFTGIQQQITQLIPLISQGWNLLILTLFTRSEVRRLLFELIPGLQQQENFTGGDADSVDASPSALLEWGVAAGITAFAFFAAPACWPAQNFINMALAILVARAIQLDRFPAIFGALSLLTLYDAASVFWVSPAMAASVDFAPMLSSPPLLDDIALAQTAFVPVLEQLDPKWTISSMSLAATENDAVPQSAMASVAMQKLTSNTFQPGLLVTKIDNRLGGALGLGDAVFPSLLAIFCRRYDLEQQPKSESNKSAVADDTGASLPNPSLLTVSMVGYLAGCLACEFAPNISTTGLPALIFIVPAMLGSVFATTAFRGDFDTLWNFRSGQYP